MHASLRLDNFSRLPEPSKALAISAGNGSLEDLKSLHRLIPDSPVAHLRLFIPAFYANLSPDELQDVNWPDRLSRAILALKGLSALQGHLVSKASVEVWSAVWVWINFFAEYQQQHPDVTSTFRIPMYTEFLTTMLSLSRDAETSAKVDATHRMRVFFTRGWLAAIEGGAMPQPLVDDLCRVLMELSFADPTTFAEMTEGAGGTLDHLASLIIQHVYYFVPHKDHTMSDRDGFGVFCIARMFRGDVSMTDGPLSDALVAHGIVKCTITVLHALCVGPEIIITEQLIPMQFVALVTRMRNIPHSPRIKEAVDNGLLPVVVLTASLHVPDLLIPLHHLLQEILPSSLSYHSVLSSLPTALEEANDLVDTPGFRTAPHFNAWNQFVSLATERVAVMRLYNSGALATRRACDNLECPEVRNDEELRRCSACQSAFYCSHPCQIADWTAGHRKLCPSQKDFGHLSTPDRAFLRALLHHDYEAARAEILAAQLRFLRAHPPGTLFFVTFNYAAGRLRFEVGPLTGSSAEFGNRVARGGGRVELHLVVVTEGAASKRGVVLAMRSGSVIVHERLAAVAAGGEPVTPAMVQELLALEVVRTH
ncbi:hypothetical protein B0H17DRAFT_16671 [Mycena rosella]|uniref:MYND-type domain-containing protein n=1 Tax=Mycena rosella TaxID=1033263 RepID=A0AAD7D8U3_MYCRO|nr:hypothetical protein B0H17DRAFT_16671 [Mycena rosella]